MPRLDFEARVALEATISPSEDPTKVLRALQNVLGGVSSKEAVTSKSVRLAADNSKSLFHLREMLRDRHVRSAARKQLLANLSRRSSSLMLNRQAAAAGVVALCASPEESPLGPIYVIIESAELDSVIDWLTAYDEG